MGNHKMEHRRTQVNTTSPIMLEVVIVKLGNSLLE